MAVEVGLQEAPRCPDNIDRRLKEFDRRLRCTFNTQHRVWQIQEQLEQSGQWTHVLFWHDGTWRDMQFRQLPYTADPLIEEILKRDFQRKGFRDIKALIADCDSRGASERARRLEEGREIARDKLRRYAAWAYERAHILQRKFEKGGRSRAQAIAERQSVLRDLGLGRPT